MPALVGGISKRETANDYIADDISFAKVDRGDPPCTSLGVSPITAFVQLPPSSAGAKLLGLDSLDPEKSTNLSFGLVAEPLPRVSITLDAYQIEIEDRIVGSGSLFGKIGRASVDAAITNAITANGNVLDPSVGTTGINLFANGLDTRTRGIEALAATWTDLGELGKIDWTLGVNVNKTKVTRIATPPLGLGGAVLYDKAAIAFLEHATPRYKVNLSSVYTNGAWTVNLANTMYGTSWAYTNVNGAYFQDRIGRKLITDLELAYTLPRGLRVALGANNLFDVYPDRNGLIAYDGSGAYGNFAPFGLSGGFYYGRVSVKF